MNKDAMRVAIATQCGWRIVEGLRAYPPIEWIKARVSPEVFEKMMVVNHMVIPDYCESLDAMAEAIKLLDKEERETYAQYLGIAMGMEDVGFHSGQPDFSISEWEELVMDSTALQRAEAFLRTVGKWSDTEAQDLKEQP